MKRWFALVLGLSALAGIALWFVLSPVDQGPSPTETAANPAQSKVVGKPVPAGADTPPAPPPGASPARPRPDAAAPPPALPAAARMPEPRAEYLADLEKVQLMLRDFRAIMRENPVGTNAEIMKSLMGGNPKQAQLGPPGGEGINGNGELVDRWGTPYFFHQVSATQMEIRSAGPDRVMWTPDDVVLR